MTETATQEQPRKIDGRTKEGRALREAARAASRTTAPRQVRDPVRDPMRGEVIGRDGEVLTRKRALSGAGGDPFEGVKAPDGWCYQWCAVSVVGNTDIVMDQNLGFAEDGWRPVPADRHPNYMPPGHKTIIRGSQMLMERPIELTEQARAEDIRKASQQMKDRDQALMGSKANIRGAMKDGFEMGGKYRGTGGDIKMSIDKGIDIPKPQHQVASGDE